MIYEFAGAYFVHLSLFETWGEGWLATLDEALDSLFWDGYWVGPGTSLTFDGVAPDFVSEALSRFRVSNDGVAPTGLDLAVNDQPWRFTTDAPPTRR